ncbi:hypothetical protein RB653_005086 [Dictyostelium firmibasis]|uniref:Uncharacterized protein n=1 Tax=Dictyostelium firmibasis TaxID=79012 RepID=A0AAN7Z3U7_9MYCE
MCNSIILENKLFDSHWENKNHIIFQNLIPTDNNNINYNNNVIENSLNTDNNNETFYNSNIPSESQLNNYSRFGFKPSQSQINSFKNNENENNYQLSFIIKSLFLLFLYILFYNYQLVSKLFIIILSLNFIITITFINSNFKFQNSKKLNKIYKLIHKIQSKIITLN